MSVEVNQRHRPVAAVMRLQQWVGDGVVAAEADDLGAAVDQRRRLLFDLANRGGDVIRGTSDVTRIYHLLAGERGHVQRRVVRPQHARALPDVRGPESRTWPIADAGVERNPDDGDVVGIDVFDPRQPPERRQPRVSGYDATVDRADRLFAHARHLVDPPFTWIVFP